MKTRFIPVAWQPWYLPFPPVAAAVRLPSLKALFPRTALPRSNPDARVYPHGQNGQRRRALRRRKIQTSRPQPSPKTAKNHSPCLNPILKATAAPCLPSGQTQPHSKPKKKNSLLRLRNSTLLPKPASSKKSKPLTAKPVQAANLATIHSAVRNKA